MKLHLQVYFEVFENNLLKGLLTDEEIKKILDNAELKYNEEMLRKQERLSEQGIEIMDEPSPRLRRNSKDFKEKAVEHVP